ncbi:MAG: Antirestriction protein (ArdA) [Pelotomaculum sp. PtaB.Bin104]|nr:MAG: Antirestriction protein (ArdA) [Pelotomaculum sp. PtaB.Bin104]
MLEAFVTNLGRYNEGYLDGEYLKLPATTEDVQALLKRIHVDGIRYEEVFITDYETDISGLYNCLGEYESIDELNYLASLLDDMDKGEQAKFEAALSYGDYTGSVKDLINLAQNLDCYEYYPGISDEDDLGRYMIDEMGAMEVPEYLENYIDYEAYGRDVSLEDGGHFAEGGYIVNNGDSFIEYYNGRDDLPEEHRIFAYPEPEKSIRDTLRQYQQMIDASPLPVKDRPDPTHEER